MKHARTILLGFGSALWLTASPAFAAPHPTDLLKMHQASSSAERSSMALSDSEAKACIKAMTEAYGKPRTERSGVKVWEVATDNARSGAAEIVTVMIGNDGRGGLVAIVDDRSAPFESQALASELRVSAANGVRPSGVDPSTRGQKKGHTKKARPAPRSSSPRQPRHVLRPEERD